MRLSLLRLLFASPLLVACSESSDRVSSCGHFAPDVPLVLLASDLRSASAAAILGTDGCLVEVAAVELGYDPVLAADGGEVLVCARDRGTVVALGAGGAPLGPTLLRTYAASSEGEEPPNPWAADVDSSGLAWIARYDLSSLGLAGPDGVLSASVSLAAFADADGLPEASALRVVEGEVVVALESLDRTAGWVAAGPSMAVVVSRETRSVVASFPLAGPNPFGPLAAAPSLGASALVIATPGVHDALEADAGITLVDVAARSSTRLVSEEALGGSALAARVVAKDEGYALVEGPVPGVNPTSLVRFDPATGVVGPTLGATDGFQLAGLAVTPRYVIVGDRSVSAPRLRFFERATGAELGGVPLTLYPPLDLAPLPGF
jgi:hypothetical protein